MEQIMIADGGRQYLLPPPVSPPREGSGEYEEILNGLTISEALHISQGTLASDITVSSGGELFVSSGGRAENTTVDWYGRIRISESGTACNTTVLAEGSMIISQGGVASSTQLKGTLDLLSGGTACDTTVRNGHLTVSNGALAQGVTLNFWGGLSVEKGGSAQNITVNNAGDLYISRGGTATEILENGGYVSVAEGAVVTFVPNTLRDFVCSAWTTLHSATAASNVVINEQGVLEIFQGGKACSTTVDPTGTLEIHSGGTATEIRENGGYVSVAEGASVTFAAHTLDHFIVEDSATLHSGTVADDITIEDLADLEIHSGGIARGVTVRNRGKLTVFAGGTATDITATAESELYFTAASGTFIEGTLDGSSFRIADGVAEGMKITTQFTVTDGGKVINAVVDEGRLTVSEGGLITGTQINSRSYCYVSSGGIAENTQCSGGTLYVSQGALHRGSLFLEENARAIISGTLDFTLTDRTADDGYLVNDLSRVQSNSKYGEFTITVTASQAQGVYKLAQGAENFKKAITIGTAEESFGTLTINGSALVRGDSRYTLKRSGGDLTLQISVYDVTPPEVPTAELSTTAPTREDVTVTLLYSEDSVLRQYKTEGGVWSDYTGPFTVSSNGIIYFRAADEAGNTCTGQTTISNIDRTPPAAPAVKADTNAPTKENVRLFITFGDDAAVREFSSDGETWEPCGTESIAKENGTFYFRCADAAGNVSPVTAFTVSSIDREAPELTIEGNPEEYTDKAVTLTCSSNEKGTFEHFNGEKWLTGNSFTVKRNGTYKFRVTDLAGNVTEETVIVDKLLQSAPPQNLQGTPGGLSWEGEPRRNYQLYLARGSIKGVLSCKTPGTEIDLYLPGKNALDWKVSNDGEEWVQGNKIHPENNEPTSFVSDGDGVEDIFIASFNSQWDSMYKAQHCGVLNGWEGTGEMVRLSGKKRFADTFTGSSDANTLLLTDAADGDALFLDDIYTARGDSPRLAGIAEIRAGAGNDVIDLTSRQFEYAGSGVIIRGGAGNDTIWANNGSNILYGDAGNDRIVGGADDDIIAGGSGNDSMHGGGGNDIFTFCSDFGKDTVEQLSGGSVTLWFAEGSEENWNAETFTYTDGRNSVKVSGVTEVTLKFGSTAELGAADAFEAESSRKVLEEAMLA